MLVSSVRESYTPISYPNPTTPSCRSKVMPTFNAMADSIARESVDHEDFLLNLKNATRKRTRGYLTDFRKTCNDYFWPPEDHRKEGQEEQRQEEETETPISIRFKRAIIPMSRDITLQSRLVCFQTLLATSEAGRQNNTSTTLCSIARRGTTTDAGVAKSAAGKSKPGQRSSNEAAETVPDRRRAGVEACRRSKRLAQRREKTVESRQKSKPSLDKGTKTPKAGPRARARARGVGAKG